MAGLAAMDGDLAQHAVFALGLGQDDRRHGIQVPHIVCDVLVVPLVRTGVEVHSNDGVGVQVVTRTLSAIQIGAGVADDEERGVGVLVDGRCHPDAAAQRLVEVTTLGC